MVWRWAPRNWPACEPLSWSSARVRRARCWLVSGERAGRLENYPRSYGVGRWGGTARRRDGAFIEAYRDIDGVWAIGAELPRAPGRMPKPGDAAPAPGVPGPRAQSGRQGLHGAGRHRTLAGGSGVPGIYCGMADRAVGPRPTVRGDVGGLRLGRVRHRWLRPAPSVDRFGEYYDDAFAETVPGPFTTEVRHCQGPWRDVAQVVFSRHWRESTPTLDRGSWGLWSGFWPRSPAPVHLTARDSLAARAAVRSQRPGAFQLSDGDGASSRPCGTKSTVAAVGCPSLPAGHCQTMMRLPSGQSRRFDDQGPRPGIPLDQRGGWGSTFRSRQS